MNLKRFGACLCLAIFTAVRAVPGFAQEAVPAPTEALPFPSQPVTQAVEHIPDFPELPAAAEGMGAEAWYFEAKKMEQSAKPAPVSSATLEFLYRLAFSFGEKTAAREAGKSLIALYLADNKKTSADSAAREWIGEFGPDWDIYKTLITIATASENHAAVLEHVAAIRKNLSSTAKAKATELSFYEYSARLALGDITWTQEALPYLKSYTVDAWGAKILRLAALAPGSSLDTASKEIALMRADFYEKNYNQAAMHAVNASEALHAPKVARQLISEAGRSFMNSQDVVQGIPFFASFFPVTAAGGPVRDPDGIHKTLISAKWEERLWVAAFYLARLWQAAGYERDAGILFLALSDEAPSAGDADGALWYWLDITLRRITSNDFEGLETLSANVNKAGSGAARSLEFAAYVEASTHWKNPASFDDLVDAFARRLLREDAWDDAVSLSILIGGRVSKSMDTRLRYLGARLVEENLSRASLGPEESPAEKAGMAYRAIIADTEAEEYYRTMSAWRLRQVPTYLMAMPDLSAAAREALSAATQDTTGGSPVNGAAPANGTKASLDLIGDYLTYDLGNLAASVAVGFIGNPDKNLVAGLAFQLSRQGEHNAALRLARDAINRGLGTRYPDLYGLVYPKAWQSIVEEAARIPAIPPALAYGIIRSESVFDPRAVSYAGAVGLSQLMPATAKETAAGLRMGNYSLTDPADNLKIGMTYYSYMLGRFERKPMRAMFAYNAGPGRMITWNKESGELPDDILLESLHLSQPRQYAKNIIQATLAYGKIHYSIDPLALLDYLILGTPLPTTPAPAIIPAQVPVPAAAPVIPPETAAAAVPAVEVEPSTEPVPADTPTAPIPVPHGIIEE